VSEFAEQHRESTVLFFFGEPPKIGEPLAGKPRNEFLSPAPPCQRRQRR
jgi:hypothetical protein